MTVTSHLKITFIIFLLKVPVYWDLFNFGLRCTGMTSLEGVSVLLSLGKVLSIKETVNLFSCDS